MEKIKINPNKRIVVLNEEIYTMPEHHYNRIFRIGKPIPKKVKVSDDDERAREHEKLCEAIRKYGKKILNADRMLRDD